MKKNSLTLLTVVTSLALAGPVVAQELSAEHQAIDFLTGRWATESEIIPTGELAPGDLEYKWVLGGLWMQVEFHGQHPGGAVWEAHVMMQYDYASSLYRAFAFFNGQEPYLYTGSMLDERTFRISHTSENGAQTGIDYRNNGDGTVYQENWLLSDDGQRRVTLKTEYSRKAEGSAGRRRQDNEA